MCFQQRLNRKEENTAWMRAPATLAEMSEEPWAQSFSALSQSCLSLSPLLSDSHQSKISPDNFQTLWEMSFPDHLQLPRKHLHIFFAFSHSHTQNVSCSQCLALFQLSLIQKPIDLSFNHLFQMQRSLLIRIGDSGNIQDFQHIVRYSVFSLT